MKLGIFTDSHYSTAELTCGVRRNSLGAERIDRALSHFKAAGCELIVCLGDLIDREDNHAIEISNLKILSEIFAKYDTPIYAVMGNHDAFAFEVDEFYSILGEKYRPKDIIGEKNLIFLDTCYFKSGRHYMPGDHDWTDTFLPNPTELGDKLSRLSGECFIFMHQNIDADICENHRLYNDSTVREILEKSGKVKAVLQGHYHLGHTGEASGIKYLTFPALCEKEDAYTVVEI